MRPAVFSSDCELRNESHGSFEDSGRSEFEANFNRNDSQMDRVVITSRNNYSPNGNEVDAEEKWDIIPQEMYYNDNIRYPQYNADPLDFLSPAEVEDLPDLDFPVPDQNIIPEMVFEKDELLCLPHPQHQGMLLPPPHTGESERLLRNSQLIPIQSSVVAHARSRKMSIAAVQERRARNTEAARRSRARRSDKITELRQEKHELLSENARLASENAKLRRLLSTLKSKLVIKDEGHF